MLNGYRAFRRFPLPKGGGRIETKQIIGSARDELVSPFRKAGGGLKLTSADQLILSIPVSPFRKAGGGLKLATSDHRSPKTCFPLPKGGGRIETLGLGTWSTWLIVFPPSERRGAD